MQCMYRKEGTTAAELAKREVGPEDGSEEACFPRLRNVYTKPVPLRRTAQQASTHAAIEEIYVCGVYLRSGRLGENCVLLRS